MKRQWMLSKKFGFVTTSEMFSTYFRSEIIRILIVVIALLFAIPFFALQLSFAGKLISVVSDGLIGSRFRVITYGNSCCYLYWFDGDKIYNLYRYFSISFLFLE